MHALVLSHASWGIPDACRRARLEPVFVGDPAEARTHLDHAEPGEIACVLVDASAPGAHRFMEWLRSHPRLLSLPKSAPPACSQELGAGKYPCPW